jgi:DnaK suppressor protein
MDPGTDHRVALSATHFPARVFAGILARPAEHLVKKERLMTAKKTAMKPVKISKPAVKSAVKPAAKKAPPTKSTAKPAAKKTVTKTATSAKKLETSQQPAAAAKKPAAKSAAAAPAKAAASAKAPAVAKSSEPKTGPRKEKEVIATFVQRNPRPVALPSDAEDGEDHNLLAGPRNVQPYIVKRGEQYMSRAQLDHFRMILQTWKRDLMREVDRTVSHMKDEAANFPDPNDRATQEEEFSLELRTRDRERKLIRKIEEALERIEDGSYGYCLETGEEIGIKRLEARPVATLSLEAQERRERREKQYGDRDDRYR